MSSKRKPLVWLAKTRKTVREFPDHARQLTGFALDTAQLGSKHPRAKPLQGFGGAAVLEIVADDDGDTYRAVYTVELEGRVYVLHAFQKKSKRGIKTSKQDIDLIRQRLKEARAVHRELSKE